MPNWCHFEMRVKGKRKNIEEAWKQIFGLDFDNGGKFLYRVHTDDDSFEFNENGIAVIKGNCAWSVRSCMFNGDGTYLESQKESAEYRYATSIDKISEDFALDIEICSEETMMGFIEEYYISKGDIEYGECYDIHPSFNFRKSY